MHLQNILKPIEKELRRAKEFLIIETGAKDDFTDEMCQHIFGGNSKYLRPALVLHVGKMLGSRKKSQLVRLAAAMEILHTATLVHDDIIDKADTRRGRPTINHMRGGEIAILFGDYLHTVAIGILAHLNSSLVMQETCRVIRQMCAGEIEQYNMSHNAAVTEKKYLSIIQRKTASLFACCCYNAAVIAGASPDKVEALALFGLLLGTAYQMLDDCRDFSDHEQQSGKTAGTDLIEGRLTLPTIHYLSSIDSFRRGEALKLIRQKNGFQILKREIIYSGGIDYTLAAVSRLLRESKAELDKVADRTATSYLLAMSDMVAASAESLSVQFKARQSRQMSTECSAQAISI